MLSTPLEIQILWVLAKISWKTEALELVSASKQKIYIRNQRELKSWKSLPWSKYSTRDVRWKDVLQRIFLQSNQNKWQKFLNGMLMFSAKSNLMLSCCFLIVLRRFEAVCFWFFNLEQLFYRTASIKRFENYILL